MTGQKKKTTVPIGTVVFLCSFSIYVYFYCIYYKTKLKMLNKCYKNRKILFDFILINVIMPRIKEKYYA